MVNDAPITIGKWSPRNSDGRYLGMIPLRRALYLSRNTVSVRLLQTVGIERTRQLFMDFGLQDNQIPRNYTIALGTPQVLPIQMATGYATFANGGYRIQPHFITRIEDPMARLFLRLSLNMPASRVLMLRKKALNQQARSLLMMKQLKSITKP